MNGHVSELRRQKVGKSGNKINVYLSKLEENGSDKKGENINKSMHVNCSEE